MALAYIEQQVKQDPMSWQPACITAKTRLELAALKAASDRLKGGDDELIRIVDTG